MPARTRCFRISCAALFWLCLSAQVPFEYFELQTITPPQSEAAALKARLAPQMPSKLYLDANTQKAGDLTLSEPFAPPVGVYKRREVFSKIQFSGENIEIIPDKTSCQAYEPQTAPPSHTVHRSALVWIETTANAYHTLPSDSPDMRITDVQAVMQSKHPVKQELKFKLWQCPDDRYAITTSVSGIYRVTYETVALPNSHRPRPAAFFSNAAKPSKSRLQTDINDYVQSLVQNTPRLKQIQSSKTVLSDLITYFQNFQSLALSEMTTDNVIGKALLLHILSEEKGLCRHRAYLFMLIALSWGYPVRIAANEIHAFIEIQHDGRWHPVELGGNASSLTVTPTAPTAKIQYQKQISFLDEHIQNPQSQSQAQDTHEHDRSYDEIIESQLQPPETRVKLRTREHAAASSKNTAPGFRFIAVSNIPNRILRDKTITISGQMRDEQFVPIPHTQFTLELTNNEHNMRIKVQTQTDADGYIKTSLSIPPDWPPGPSDIQWHMK